MDTRTQGIALTLAFFAGTAYGHGGSMEDIPEVTNQAIGIAFALVIFAG